MASITLAAPALTIAAAFLTLAAAAPPPGHPRFMLAVAVATAGYVAAAARLAVGPALSRPAIAACLALALGWRIPLLALPEEPAADAIRYIWDARVQRAGLNPYAVRPADTVVDGLHTTLTRQVDAAWLPTIYPPAAQLYFRTVAAVEESLRAFRVAALACDAGIAIVLLHVLRATGRPDGLVLLYAWHPLPPLEAASGAHVDFAGVLLLVLSWLALLRLQRGWAAVAFVAAVLVKPLPIVLAPLYWKRVRVRDGLAAVAAGGLLTAWIARGSLPFGSLADFVADFRFNGPLFAALEQVADAHVVTAAAVAGGLLVAALLRLRGAIDLPHAWAWPMAAALLAAPVVYPWYIIWLIPFAVGWRTAPVWIWTLSIGGIYPTWFLSSQGGPFEVPPVLLAVEFAPVLAAVLAVIWMQRERRRGGR